MRRRDTSSLRMPRFAVVAAALCAALILSSCLTAPEPFPDSGAGGPGTPGGQTAPFTLNRLQSVMLAAAAHAAAGIKRGPTPEQEYRIGRAVAATILSTYAAYDSAPLNTYLNLLGQGLALHSARPEIYSGYRFLALDSGEVNAFATPGGHIMVTRGLLRLARDEDELAAVLAHEIAHVNLRHGMEAVKGSRMASFAARFAIAAGRVSGGGIAAFTEAFGDEISAIALVLIVSGYSKAYEFEADLLAAGILARAGYDPRALTRVLARMESGVEKGSPGFGATHPDPADRRVALETAMAEGGIPSSPKAPKRRTLRAYAGETDPLEPGSADQDFPGLDPSLLPFAPLAPRAMIREERFREAGKHF